MGTALLIKRLLASRLSLRLWLAGWRRHGGQWSKDVRATDFISETDLYELVGRVNDQPWMGADAGDVRVLGIDFVRCHPGWLLTFRIGRTPDGPPMPAAAEAFGTTDFARWLGA